MQEDADSDSSDESSDFDRSTLRQVGNVKVFFDKRFLRIELSDILVK